MKLNPTPQFRRIVKKMHPPEKAALDGAIREILANPSIGEAKVGDLAGIRVHKYKHHAQLMLVSYLMGEDEIFLTFVGTHENFYRDLKQH